MIRSPRAFGAGRRGLWLFPALLFLTSCASPTPWEGEVSPAVWDSPPAWQEAAPGILIAPLVLEVPPLRAWAARIDLHTPGLEVEVSPGEEPLPPGKRQGRARGRRTSSAVEEFHWDLGVNAAPFSPYVWQEGYFQRIHGLLFSQGALYSPPLSPYAAFLMESGGKGRIASFPQDLLGISLGVGGFFLILDQGEVSVLGSPRNPLTLLGTGPQGRFLYLLVVDGRQPRWSVGLTLSEGARWLRRLGAWQGMNLDGGGSTTLAVRVPGKGVQVMNRPVDGGIIGRERVVPVHLGFRVRSPED